MFANNDKPSAQNIAWLILRLLTLVFTKEIVPGQPVYMYNENILLKKLY